MRAGEAFVALRTEGLGQPRATLAQAVDWANRIGARQTWFTHISHDLGHEETNRSLPAGMALAHDGLVLHAEIGSAA